MDIWGLLNIVAWISCALVLTWLIYDFVSVEINKKKTGGGKIYEE